VLGLNATLTLALSFSLVKCLRGAKSNGINHPLYWRRALLAATSARALADAMHHPCPEEIFLAALLQDVGILALDQAMPISTGAGTACRFIMPRSRRWKRSACRRITPRSADGSCGAGACRNA